MTPRHGGVITTLRPDEYSLIWNDLESRNRTIPSPVRRQGPLGILGGWRLALRDWCDQPTHDTLMHNGVLRRLGAFLDCFFPNRHFSTLAERNLW
jgi:hypothetical protein